MEVVTDQWVVRSSSVVFSKRRKLGHGIAFYKLLTLGAHSTAKKPNLPKENNFVALPPFPKLSAKFQRNRLRKGQDTTFFSVRPPPKCCLINLFMSSLSPAALKNFKEFKGIISESQRYFERSERVKRCINVSPSAPGLWRPQRIRKRVVADGVFLPLPPKSS